QASFKRERDALIELVQTESTRNLVQFFFMQERAKKADPASAGAPGVKTGVGVGAGTMGGGIADAASSRGLKVNLRDIDAAATERGLVRIRKIYEENVRRGLLTQEEAQKALQQISTENSDSVIKEADLIIEAAVEQLEVKQQIFKVLDQKASATAML